MTKDRLWSKLRNKGAVTRTIRVKPEGDGMNYLLEVVDTSLTHPKFSWTLFGALSEAEAGAQAQYEASLKEGFAPLP